MIQSNFTATDAELFIYELKSCISNLVNQVNLLTTENQAIKERLTYLEYDLHAENSHLRDDNLAFRQFVDYNSEEYRAIEDSLATRNSKFGM